MDATPVPLIIVSAVLLPDGEWHEVEPESFLVKPMYLEIKGEAIPGTQELHFVFIEPGQEDRAIPNMIHGPLTSIKAYRTLGMDSTTPHERR